MADDGENGQICSTMVTVNIVTHGQHSYSWSTIDNHYLLLSTLLNVANHGQLKSIIVKYEQPCGKHI